MSIERLCTFGEWSQSLTYFTGRASIGYWGRAKFDAQTVAQLRGSVYVVKLILRHSNSNVFSFNLYCFMDFRFVKNLQSLTTFECGCEVCHILTCFNVNVCNIFILLLCVSFSWLPWNLKLWFPAESATKLLLVHMTLAVRKIFARFVIMIIVVLCLLLRAAMLWSSPEKKRPRLDQSKPHYEPQVVNLFCLSLVFVQQLGSFLQNLIWLSLALCFLSSLVSAVFMVLYTMCKKTVNYFLA